MKIFGKDLSKTEIMKKIGDLSQLGEIKFYEYTDGLSKGVRAADIKTPYGIDLTVLIDRGMDLSRLAYKGISLNWKSAARESSPVFYDSKGLEWMRTFYGGMLTTCGLSYMGSPCTDNGEELGLHGRISHLPAEKVSSDIQWVDNTCEMWISGKIREVFVLGDKYELTRKITAWMDRPVIKIDDTVENIGSKPSPLMMLYHINIGYPLLDSTSILLEKNAKVTALDDESAKGIEEYMKFSEPRDDYVEQVFYHDIESDKDGNAQVAIINKKFNGSLGIGLLVKYSKNTLPYLVQWKQMGGGEYVCGLEPANSYVRGRKIEREDNKLKFINPGEKVNFSLEFIVLTSNEEIKLIEKEMEKR